MEAPTSKLIWLVIIDANGCSSFVIGDRADIYHVREGPELYSLRTVVNDANYRYRSDTNLLRIRDNWCLDISPVTIISAGWLVLPNVKVVITFCTVVVVNDRSADVAPTLTDFRVFEERVASLVHYLDDIA